VKSVHKFLSALILYTFTNILSIKIRFLIFTLYF
jgi:hypothetical protein